MHGLSSQGARIEQQQSGSQGRSKEFEIPTARVDAIASQPGDTINALQIQSGPKIQVNPQCNYNSNSGNHEDKSNAEQSINEIAAKGEGPLAPTTMQFEMVIDNTKRHHVIGKDGNNINYMQSKSGAKIKVIPKELSPGNMTTISKVFIHGETENVERAKLMLNEVIAQGYRPPRRDYGVPGNPPQKEPSHGYKPPEAYWN